MIMTSSLELRKQGLLVSLRTELVTFQHLCQFSPDRGPVENSRRKILGYCDELESIEQQEAA